MLVLTYFSFISPVIRTKCFYYVCKYSPAGNFIGEPVYGSGTAVEPIRMPTTRPLRLMWFNKA